MFAGQWLLVNLANVSPAYSECKIVSFLLTIIVAFRLFLDMVHFFGSGTTDHISDALQQGHKNVLADMISLVLLQIFEGPPLPTIPANQGSEVNNQTKQLMLVCCMALHQFLLKIKIQGTHMHAHTQPQPHTLIHHTRTHTHKHACTCAHTHTCLLYTSPSPRDQLSSRMPSAA